MIETTDGATLAQLSLPDMRLPIGYALAYPDRLPRAVRGHRLDGAVPAGVRGARSTRVPVPRPGLSGRSGRRRWPRRGSTAPTRWRSPPSSTAVSVGRPSPRSPSAPSTPTSLPVPRRAHRGRRARGRCQRPAYGRAGGGRPGTGGMSTTSDAPPRTRESTAPPLPPVPPLEGGGYGGNGEGGQPQRVKSPAGRPWSCWWRWRSSWPWPSWPARSTC